MFENFTKLINSAASLVGGGLSTLLMGLAFAAFLFSIINFIWKRRNGDGSGLEAARNTLWWSVVALFVMVSVWGLVKFIGSNLLGGDANTTTIQRPQTTFGSGSNNTSNNNIVDKNGNPLPQASYSNEGKNYPSPIKK